jgi:hypothetical protein
MLNERIAGQKKDISGLLGSRVAYVLSMTFVHYYVKGTFGQLHSLGLPSNTTESQHYLTHFYYYE